MQKRKGITLIAWAVTIGALAWFLYDLRGEWGNVGRAIGGADLFWILAASGILLGELSCAHSGGKSYFDPWECRSPCATCSTRK